MAKSKIAFNGASRTTAFTFDPEDLWVIGVDTKDRAEHPLYDPRVDACKPVAKGDIVQDGNFDALVASIAAHGVIQPVVVARSDDGDPVVVAGRRRVLAARRANELGASVRVPAIRIDGDPITLFEHMVTENELRVDDGPLEKAAKLARYFDLDASKTDDDAARMFGVTKQTIANWRRLLECSPRVRAAVAAEEISPTAASKLGRLSYDEQDAKLEELTSGTKRASVRDAEAVAGDRPKAPGKRFLARLAEHMAGDSDEVVRGFAQGVQFAIGAIPGEEVPGLDEAIRDMNEAEAK